MSIVETDRVATQRVTALAHANAVRLARAALKRELRNAGRRDAPPKLAGWLTDPPEWLGAVRVSDALGWLPGWGPDRTMKLLRSLDVSPERVICVRPDAHYSPQAAGLTVRQRQVIAGLLRGGV